MEPLSDVSRSPARTRGPESAGGSKSWGVGRILLVLGCLAIGLGLGYAYYSLAPKVYRATATVLVLPTATGLDAGTTAATSDINMETEAELARSVSLATEVSDGLDGQLSDLAASR